MVVCLLFLEEEEEGHVPSGMERNSLTFCTRSRKGRLRGAACSPVSVGSSDLGVVIYLFIYLGFYIAFNTVQVISRRVVGRAEETSTYSSLGFCTVNSRPTASNYQLFHLRPCLGVVKEEVDESAPYSSCSSTCKGD